MECPKYYYHDHGTDKCEHCCDICCKAKLQKTSAQCETYCPKYALKLRTEAAQQLQNDLQKLKNSDGSGNAQDSGGLTFPPAAQVAVPVVSALFILLLISLILAKRKAIVRKFRQRRRRVTADRIEDGAAGVPLQTEPSLQYDVNLMDEVTREPLSQPQPGEAVQESGKASGGGDNSWRLLSDQQTATFNGLGSGGELRGSTPLQESLEGRQGPEEMVLPTGTRRRTDSTELKTVLPSLTMSESTV